MNTRTFALTTAFFAATAGFAFAADAVIPPGVIYKPASAEVDAKARQAVKDAFAVGGDGVAKLMFEMVQCEPAYWAQIHGDPSIQAVQTIRATIVIPTGPGRMQKLPSGIFTDASARASLALRLAADVGPAPVIRKLTTDEMSVHWALISFDMVEPIYILECGAKRYCVTLGGLENGRLAISWVDEISTYRHGR